MTSIKYIVTSLLMTLVVTISSSSLTLTDELSVQQEQTEVVEFERPSTQEFVKLPESKKPTYKSLGIGRITAYCPCTSCSDNWGRQTATGVLATQGVTVAVDPKVIPYGSIVVINGKEYIAQDCGGAIDDNDIDIYFDSHADALKWGVKYIEVFVLVEEK